MTRKVLHVSLLSILNDHLLDYPTPSNISYFYGGGFLAGICLTIQIVTGILLAMHYTPHVSLAFYSVEHIMRDVNHGWLIRYTHANGASIFFMVVYFHIARGIYYSSFSYPKSHLWNSGVVIFILMMATAFMGYVLPWGQMSFWGATVITNLFSAIPYVGGSIAFWLWGGYSVDNATLNRFFSLHYLLPFLILGLVLVHISLLHLKGSSTPLGFINSSGLDGLSFYPYFVLKDIFSLLLLCMLFTYLVCFKPNLLGHPDNYIKANALVTPTHIVPEWYFLPFYAILRSIPDKLGGVVCMGLSIACLFILPVLCRPNIQGPLFRPFYVRLTFLFFFNVLFLGYLGCSVVEYPYVILSQISTAFYFLFLLVLLPLVSLFENTAIK
jgi:ubiquinol-cytochrome c reductase cytochrome b subunit